jgi:3-hydroxyisobutyrate dehydrogenase-like beta-hydroxyacid dehydrogenase
LAKAGHRVVTALNGRSSQSRKLAQDAGLEDLRFLTRVIEHCDVFLSILPPAVAFEFARDAAAIIASSRRALCYVDCNAVAPATVRRIASLFDDGPARFVDVGIVGPAPTLGCARPPRFYVSGIERTRVFELQAPEIAHIDMGASIGRASALKMCYAGLNKGVDALFTNILLASRRLDVAPELLQELEASQRESARRIAKRVPFLAATAERYTGEMLEIAAAFDAAGVSGDFHRGAAWLYEVLSRSNLALETRASLPDERSLEQALSAFAAVLDRKA